MNKFYFIQTFGCQMNVHDSEKIAGVLESFGYKSTETPENASVVVLNTCTIRELAEKKIESYIGNLKAQKSTNKDMIIIVCGCMTQQNGRAEELVKKFPFIDIVFGTHNLANFEDMFRNFLTNNKKIVSVVDKLVYKKEEKVFRTSGLNAWINIMHGCNNFCSYCIVPYVRGREISRPFEDILDEARKLISDGYKQITLLGQNVNSYGNDIPDENVNFAKLLSFLDTIPGKYRIRFMTPHPKDFSDEVIEVISKSKHICHGIHLPVQSGSNDILEKMNRKYTRENYLALVDKIKLALPDAELTTDIIVGFPNETDKDFEDTMDLVEKVKYQQIFNFIYSKRKGTVAEKMDGQVPMPIKKQRLSRLIDRERQIASEISQSYIGKTIEVLVENKRDKFYVGTTDGNKNINFTTSCQENLVGEFVNVKVTSSKLTVLYGEMTL